MEYYGNKETKEKKKELRKGFDYHLRGIAGSAVGDSRHFALAADASAKRRTDRE